MRDADIRTVCVLGAGGFGTALALRLADHGIATRVAARKDGSGAPAAPEPLWARDLVRPTPEALDGADAVVLALPFTAALNLAERFPGFAEGRIVVDATNPLTEEGDGLLLPAGVSGAVEIARRVPYARLVKGFSTHTVDDLMGSRTPAPVNFVAGDDESAKYSVIRLSRRLSLPAVDAGVLAHCSVLEGMVLLREEIVRRNRGRPGTAAAVSGELSRTAFPEENRS
ncbi:NAD(P)-binding domain-containing protein [Streptomyces sp. NPDC006662]|uniref:NADPH-dependent F420 reductase n=1 Tax=Streptomyces sp. NPDC006662 TaxID=3156902 RepID=UPI0033F89F6E